MLTWNLGWSVYYFWYHPTNTSEILLEREINYSKGECRGYIVCDISQHTIRNDYKLPDLVHNTRSIVAVLDTRVAYLI